VSFKVGDRIVHLRYGAGIVIEPRIIERDAETCEYFCIELCSDRGVLMIPVSNVDDDEIRLAMSDANLIREIMHTPPAPLVDDHRVRQNEIKAQIKSGDPRQLVQVLRDLCWREQIGKLTFTDSQLKDKVHRLLAQELALNPSVAIESARNRIAAIIENAMQTHLAKHGALS